MSHSVAIKLSRSGAEAVFATRLPLIGRPITRRAQFGTDADLLAEGAALAECFKSLARALPIHARRPDTPASIALPDPLVTEELLTFRDFPGTGQEAADLVAWRYCREHQRAPSDTSVAHQVLATDGSETTVLVRALPRAVCDRVQDAARRAGFFVSRLDGFAGYLPDLAAQVSVDAESWVVLAAGAGEHLYRAGWRDEPERDLETIQRLLRIYARKQGGRVPVRISGTDPMADDLLAALSGDALEPQRDPKPRDPVIAVLSR